MSDHENGLWGQSSPLLTSLLLVDSTQNVKLAFHRAPIGRLARVSIKPVELNLVSAAFLNCFTSARVPEVFAD